MTDVDSKRGELRRSIARYHRDYETGSGEREKSEESERASERQKERERRVRLREGQGVVKRRAERKVGGGYGRGIGGERKI